jgi:mannose-6-phosphate isomerase-like protein (cupin superfamily)
VVTKRNVHEAPDQIDQLWSLHVLGEVNDYDIKVANVAGEFAEHVHDDTDEVFLVLAGRLHLDLPDTTVTLDPMDLCTVPRGVPATESAPDIAGLRAAAPEHLHTRGVATTT